MLNESAITFISILSGVITIILCVVSLPKEKNYIRAIVLLSIIASLYYFSYISGTVAIVCIVLLFIAFLSFSSFKKIEIKKIPLSVKIILSLFVFNIMILKVYPYVKDFINEEIYSEKQEKLWSRYYKKDLKNEQINVSYPYSNCFQEESLIYVNSDYKLPLTLLLAIARGESDFKKDKVSKDRYGIMQIQFPDIAKAKGIDEVHKLFEPCYNVKATAMYLNDLLIKYKGNVHLVLIAYQYENENKGISLPLKDLNNSKNKYKKYINYSEYIYYHLNKILNNKKSYTFDETKVYGNFIKFDDAYKHLVYINKQLEKSTRKPRLDLTKAPNTSEYQVVIRYRDKEELTKSLEVLNKYQIFPY